MPPETNAPDQWQSIEQWMDSDGFRDLMRDEFPEDAAEWLDPVSRRQFLALAGASVALATGAGCNPSLKPASQRKVVPYVDQPAELLPNVPLYFATAMPQAGGVGLGLLVRSNEGRPTKVEGNPNHPSSRGGTNVYAQGSVLGLYDPDRSKEVLNRQVPTTFERALAAIKDKLNGQKGKGGAGVRVVADPSTSPTFGRLMGEFLKLFPQAKWASYEPLARDSARRAAEKAFGAPADAVYRFDQAKVVLALDADFLGADCPASVRYARDFMTKRKVREGAKALAAGDGVKKEAMNRLYAVEAVVTCTGASADHRLPLKPSQVEAFAKALAAKLGVGGVAAGDLPEPAKKWIDPLAADLQKAAGQAVVVTGEHQPPAVHLLALAINEKLGAFGKTVLFVDPLEARPPAASATDIAGVAKDLRDGAVELLLLLGTNPAFDAPADLDFAQLLEKTKATTVHFGPYRDETAARCQWHVNAAHYLECWGDIKAHDGTVTIQQPLIAPLFGGRSAGELLAQVLQPYYDPTDAGAPATDGLGLVQQTWQKLKPDGFEGWWQKAVRDGVVPGTGVQFGDKPAGTVARTGVKLDGIGEPGFAAPATKSGALEVQFRQDPTLYDGRFANNGWLQELPRPITKMAWDNAALVSPATADKLGCSVSFGWTGGENGRSHVDVVELTVGDKKLSVAVFVLPGHADDAVTLYLGSGRERVGTVGKGAGFNTYKVRTTASPWIAPEAQAKATGRTFTIACTQGQTAMESRRPVRTATVAQFAADEDFAQVPAATAGEYKEIRALTPGTQEDWVRLHGEKGAPYPYADHAHGHAGHAHDEKKDGEGHAHGHHDERLIPLSLYPKYPQEVNGVQASASYRRWGMAIDLNACTGCSACVAACVSENNIPVVGKEQVTKGRAMHWIRIDRYFSIPGPRIMSDELGGKNVGPEARKEQAKKSAAIHTHVQPVLCQHCEKAPCEVVCPVGATVHSADGLNDMVYNRCVGTRYCSNNCPYKVRRFNFLQYADYTTASLKLMNNPEVTVRTRGVMEKCTYCVQRIRGAEIEAEREWKQRLAAGLVDADGRPKIADGEVVTACQSACPTGAIAFGDLNDPTSAVLRWKAEPHNYGLLAELNTMPRTSYLAEVRNPNPDLEPAAAAAKGA